MIKLKVLATICLISLMVLSAPILAKRISTNSCTDSDGGKDIFTFGEITIIGLILVGLALRCKKKKNSTFKL